MGIDLSQIEGTGSGGLVTVKDVTSLSGDSSAEGQAAGQAQEAVGQATDQAGQAVQGAQEATGQVTDQATGALGGVTDQVGQVAQGVQDTAGQATQQAQETAGQATQQAQDAAGQVTGQAAGEDEDEEPKGATNAARRKAEELGVDLSQVQGSGAGGLITLRDVTGS
jgi:pyruvate/2-oxoglutarate dehydrogenase complex dihydrolipoamide acyltransferase (E2) component